MTTDELIDTLSASTRSTANARPTLTLALAGMTGLLVVLALIAVALGFRADLAASFTHPSVWMKYGATGLVLIAAAVAVRRLSIPGGQWKGAGPMLASIFVVIAIWALADINALPRDRWLPCLAGGESLTCLVGIALLSMVPMLTLGLAVRRLAPTRLEEAGALIGLAGGAIAALAYSLHCPEDAIPFLALWYTAALALCAAAGRLAGPKLLRW